LHLAQLCLCCTVYTVKLAIVHVAVRLKQKGSIDHLLVSDQFDRITEIRSVLAAHFTWNRFCFPRINIFVIAVERVTMVLINLFSSLLTSLVEGFSILHLLLRISRRSLPIQTKTVANVILASVLTLFELTKASFVANTAVL
jgi:hypothetical protein